MNRTDILAQRTRRKRKYPFIRRSITCLTSNITLFCFLSGYIIAGGFLFRRLEGEAEKQRIKKGDEAVQIQKEKFLALNRAFMNSYKAHLLNRTNANVVRVNNLVKTIEYCKPNGSQGRSMHNRLNQLKINRLNQLVSNIVSLDHKHYDNNISSEHNISRHKAIDKFIEEIYKSIQEGFIINYKSNSTALWTLSGAILYSVTVITTIGYGNIVPMTNGGKVATIIYSMVGIPLMLLCLTNLGFFFAQSFKFIYKCTMNRFKCPFRSVKRSSSVMSLTNNPMFSNIKTLSLPNNKLFGKNLLILSSKSTTLTKITESSSDMKKKLHFTITMDSSDFMKNLQKTVDHHDLPLLLPLLFFIIYILVGAYLISYWENWIYLNSCYFVFVTLSTIGFGDFVPGSLNNQWKDQSKPIICALYLLFGLVLLSMCFQLMQDMFLKRATRLGRHIGLVNIETE